MVADKKFDVFLSHNSKDKQWVIKLKDSLESKGIKVWLDEEEIRPGDLFAKALEQGIQESRSLALIISPESMRSGWVEAEYYRALSLTTSNAMRLIPVLYKNAQVPGFLSDRHYVDFSDKTRFDESVNELIWGITGEKTKPTKGKPNTPVVPVTKDMTAQADVSGESMPKRLAHYVTSAIALVFLILVIHFGISLNLIVPKSIIEWISASSSPQLALWTVSTLIAAVLVTLSALGFVDLPNKLSQANRELFLYLFGLRWWVTLVISVISVTILIFVQPVCQSPTASIRVRVQNNETFEYSGMPIDAKPGDMITLSAISNDNTVIFCSWSNTGTAVERINSKSLCSTQVQLSNDEGRGIITLTASKSSCSVVTTTPLEIVTVSD